MRSKAVLILSLTCLAALSTAAAGELAVRPVRLFLEAGRVTESIQLRNGSSFPLPLQLRAYEWHQDDQGRDDYRPTDRLIFFPRMMTLEPGEERIVRIGVNGIAPEKENCYRLYLEELPEPEAAPSNGLRTILRVGVPIFRRPLSTLFAGEVVDLGLQDCRASFRVANRGNAHLMLRGVTLSAFDRAGKELMTAELKGWYLLAETERPFEHQLPDDVCRETERLQVSVDSDQNSFEGVVDVPL